MLSRDLETLSHIYESNLKRLNIIEWQTLNNSLVVALNRYRISINYSNYESNWSSSQDYSNFISFLSSRSIIRGKVRSNDFSIFLKSFSRIENAIFLELDRNYNDGISKFYSLVELSGLDQTSKGIYSVLEPNLLLDYNNTREISKLAVVDVTLRTYFCSNSQQAFRSKAAASYFMFLCKKFRTMGRQV